MASHTRTRRLISESLRIAALAAAALASSFACSDESPSKDSKPAASPFATYSIKIFSGANEKRVDLPPLEERAFRVPFERLKTTAEKPKVSGAFSKPQAAGTPPAGGKSKPLATIETPDGGVVTSDDLDSPLGWALVYGAAYECGMGSNSLLRDYPQGQSPVLPPWSGPYFIYSAAPAHCDQQLAYEEHLLCISDKLAQIADAPMPLHWTKVPASPTISGMPPGPWRIPPQATKDRFIARDIALHIAALVGFTDLTTRPPPPGESDDRTCARSYGEAAALALPPLPEVADYYQTVVFGVTATTPSPYFPPVGMSVEPTNFSTLAKARMLFKAHVLRAAGRLIRDQLDKGIAADMAGAEQQRALATDPDRGARLMWGAATESTQPYNSLAHATRLTTGRLETGLPEASTLCADVAPMGLLSVAGLGPEYEARYADRGVTTKDQEIAAKLIDQAGIVVPENTALTATASSLRTAIRDQLVANAATIHGLPANDPGFNDWGQGRALEAVVEGLADEDIRFALLRSASAYRQLTSTGKDESISLSAPGGGLTAASTVETLAFIGGIAIDGGVPRKDLTVDFSARAGGLQTASQCEETDPETGAILADTGGITAFQNLFFAGETLKKRLIALREEADLIWDEPDEVVTVPNKAAAELRTWAGHGRVVLRASGTPMDTIGLFLVGFNPEDFAVSTNGAIADEIVLVHGPPWVADCAARIRTSCPENFDDQYLLRHANAVVHSDNDPSTYGFDRSWSRVVGADGTVIELEFDVLSAPTMFAPTYIDQDNPVSRLYVVARHNPTAPTGGGRVLGALSPKSDGGQISVMVSVVEKEKQKGSIGVDPDYDQVPFQPYDPGGNSSTPPDYCEFDREPFVPLENELTSDSDQYESSWRHYLQLATEAATRADELGQQLIDFGFQKDLRREAAGEELAQICGDYSALDEVPFDKAKGKVGTSSTDKSLNTCISENRKDIVFLTTVPTALATTPQQDQSDWLRENVLLCSENIYDENPLCNEAKHPELSFSSLDITEHVAFGVPGDVDCEITQWMTQAIANGSFLGTALKTLATAPWVSGPAFRSILNQIELRVAQDGTWKALYGGAEIMNTEAPAGGAEPLWPYCAFTPDPVFRCAANGPGTGADPLSVHFDIMFRPDLLNYSPTNPASKMALLWRVQGALWMLGGLAGEVPSGLLTGFVPAARLDTGWGDTELVPLPSVYAHGGYDSIGSGLYTLQLPVAGQMGEVTDSDVQLIGPVQHIDPSFDLTATSAPGWLKSVYATPSRFLHVPSRNTSYFRSANSSLKDDLLGLWLLKRGDELDGMTCPELSGAPSNPNATYTTGADHIAKVKMDTWSCAKQSAATITGGAVTSPWSNNFTCEGTIGATPFTVQANERLCLYGPGQNLGSYGHVSYARPTLCTPNQRMTVFANSYSSKTVPCTMATELSQALGVACALSKKGLLPVPTEQPEIATDEDLAKLERWFGELERVSSAALSRLYLQNVPDRVISDFKSGSVGSGSLKGSHGQLVLELESAIQGIGQGWPQMAGRFAKMRSALEGARLQIDMNKLQSQIEEQQILIARWQAHSKMAHSLATAVSSFGIGTENGFNPVGGVAQSAAAAVDAAAYVAELAALDEIEKLQGKLANTNTAAVLNTLEDSTTTLYGEAATALGELRKTTAGAASISEALRMSELAAQYELAMGAGASFMVSDGDVIEFPVNIVLNRQYDVTRKRYEAAFKEARYLAYVAQIAVEQRLGRRLNSFTEDIGPLEAPSKWPPVCSLAGIDYEKLRDVVVPDGGFESADAGLNSGEFADMFIGDWVDRLAKFVEFYNMEYPSHDGDDIAVISLRDELLGPTGICTKQSPNLLLYSSDLSGQHAIEGASGITTVGWVRRPCTATDTRCLRLAIPATLDPVPAPPVEGGSAGGMTWLHEIDASAIIDPVELALISATTAPARLVYQEVTLDAKPHTLSWWDQGRNGSGQPGASSPYPVTIYDAQWNPILTKTYTPHVPTAGDAGADGGSANDEWSNPRRELQFTPPAPGVYHVAFSASDGSSGLGSVVIANVQLEAGAVLGPYHANGSSPLTLDTSCAAGNPVELQQAFEHSCDTKGACFYELASPVSISTHILDSGDSNLIGKLAKDNFNYRHITLALNVVGSGVLDCALETTSSCYGSGYVEYTLDHTAFDVEVLSHEPPKEAQHFNFGLAFINHGKALAAERFITLPLGSADQALLAQPAFEKTEYMGRPLDGSYVLRIHDKPSLRWNNVEDVQFVLKYRYWSRIQPYPSP